jgi:hypothetical protein
MIKVYFRTPYSTNKNLGEAYNEEMDMIPDGHSACFTDGDILFLSHDYGHIITEYANRYPNAVLTCWTNRIHKLAKDQLNPKIQSSDIRDHLKVEQGLSGVTICNGPVSGFLMVIPKHIWQKFPFSETNFYNSAQPNLLGVDNEWTNRIRSNGVQVLRMNGVYVWHTYRLLSDGTDKSHLTQWN